jgi:SAM-dependent methyltransferase
MDPEGHATTRVATSAKAVCAACGGEGLESFFEMPETPANCVTLRSTREAALSCRTGRIQLGFCPTCGAVSNIAFDSARVDYDPSYDNSLHFSATFRKYAEGVARDLVERHSLRDKTIIDIGCGNAEFLSMMCSLGNNRGIGFDPSFIPGRADLEAGKGITIVPEYYSAELTPQVADFVICRHVLEHIPDPRNFLRTVRPALAENSDAAIFFELPNASFVFRKKSIWDVIYEHCFYYDSGALARLFSSCGFDVIRVCENFDGQYLNLEARTCSGDKGTLGHTVGDPCSMRHEALQFADSFRSYRAHWEGILGTFSGEGKRVALWGAGAKGSMFLNAFRGVSSLEYIVDVNPHKCGLYIPGSGQKVVSPEFLKQYRPDVILIMNANYRDEISRQVSALGITPDLLSI